MIQFEKHGIPVRLDDGLTRSPDVEDFVDAVIRDRIEHPFRIYRGEHDGLLRVDHVPAKNLESYKQTMKPVAYDINGMKIKLYPVFGLKAKDINKEALDLVKQTVLEPLFITKEEGELCVSF